MMGKRNKNEANVGKFEMNRCVRRTAKENMGRIALAAALSVLLMAGCGTMAPIQSETAVASALEATAAATADSSASAAPETSSSAAAESATASASAGTKPMRGGGGGGMMQNADTSSITTKHLDVAYATASETQKLDIYLPNEGTGPFPVIVQIHGGAFKSGDKASGELTPALSGLARGYAVVAVNYRLSGEAQFPAQINDIKAAIRFVRANAAQYNLNPDKIATWGGSAGGSLSALAGTSGDVVALQDDSLGNAGVSDRIQACVDWFGPIFFSDMDAQFAELGITPVGVTSDANSPESQYLGQTVGSSAAEELVKQASAMTYISADDPAFFIEHGTADQNIPITQSMNFADALKTVLGVDKVTFTQLEGAGHGTSEFMTEENVAKVLDFLDAEMK